MLRFAHASALLLGAASVAGTPATTVVGKSLAPPPQSRLQAAVAIDDTTAAALVGAISSQFGARMVQVRLGQIDLEPAGLVQRDVRGSGELRIGRDGWIPFCFRTLYDTEHATAGSPELTLGTESPKHAVSRGGAVAASLMREVGQRLRGEFPQQTTSVRVHDVRSVPVGAYLRVEAGGIVAFGSDGTATARVHGLYDPRGGRWLQVAYELGNDRAIAPPLATR